MKYILYSTSGSKWYQEQANIAASYLSRVQGIDKIKIDVVDIRAPKEVDVVKDKTGDYVIAWEFFKRHFPKGEYDGVGFFFTPYYKRKWGIKGLNGRKHTENKDYPEWWMCTYKGQAEGYEFSDFVRLLIHEISHFFEDLDDGTGNKLTQSSVHVMDYQLKAIHRFPELVDFRGYLFKQKVNKIINRLVDLVRQTL